MESKFGDQKYDVSVYDSSISRSQVDENGKISSGCYVFVYDAGTKTLATIYGGPQRETLANPISRSQFATDGAIKFYGAASSYDIVVNDDKGNTGVYSSVTPLVHSVNLNRSGADKCLVFPLAFDASGAEVDTGLDVPYKSHIYDAGIEVVTTDSGETCALGLLSSETAGDADGIMLATSTANAGFFGLYAITDGSSEDYVSAARSGLLMGLGSVGTDAGNDFGQPGGPGHYVTGSNAKSITYTVSSSDTFAGYGFVKFTVIR